MYTVKCAASLATNGIHSIQLTPQPCPLIVLLRGCEEIAPLLYSVKSREALDRAVLIWGRCVNFPPGNNWNADRIPIFILQVNHYCSAEAGYGILRLGLFISDLCATVQTFNSCTSRPDVCQWLVVKTPMVNISKEISQIYQWLTKLVNESYVQM